jgi:hypothetical protein
MSLNKSARFPITCKFRPSTQLLRRLNVAQIKSVAMLIKMAFIPCCILQRRFIIYHITWHRISGSQVICHIFPWAEGLCASNGFFFWLFYWEISYLISRLKFPLFTLSEFYEWPVRNGGAMKLLLVTLPSLLKTFHSHCKICVLGSGRGLHFCTVHNINKKQGVRDDLECLFFVKRSESCHCEKF